MKSLTELQRESVAIDLKLHSERGNELYADFPPAEKYRLIVAGKTGAERESRRLQPILKALEGVVEAAEAFCDDETLNAEDEKMGLRQLDVREARLRTSLEALRLVLEKEGR